MVFKWGKKKSSLVITKWIDEFIFVLIKKDTDLITNASCLFKIWSITHSKCNNNLAAQKCNIPNFLFYADTSIKIVQVNISLIKH